MSLAEFLNRGEVPDDVVLVLVLPRPEDDEAVSLVDRDGELELPQAVEERLQELGHGLDGHGQERQHQAHRHELVIQGSRQTQEKYAAQLRFMLNLPAAPS